jgi:sulfonate transport system permease protein
MSSARKASLIGRLSQHKRRLYALSPLLLLALWQLAAETQFFPAEILVPPKVVFLTFIDLIQDGELVPDLEASAVRLILGFGIGTGLGLFYGLWVGLVPAVERYTGLVFHIFRQIPTIALVPLFILFFGIEETFKIAMIAFAAFFPVALNTLDGIRNVPRQYREVAEIFRFNSFSVIRRVVLPGALPSIVTGFRLALSRSWLILVAAELFASSVGVGHLMDWGRQLFQIDVVMVGVVIAGVVGFALDSGLRTVESRFSVWKAPTA